MGRTELLQEIREMRFEEVYWGWAESRLGRASFRRVPVDEVIAVVERYQDRYWSSGTITGTPISLTR